MSEAIDYKKTLAMFSETQTSEAEPAKTVQQIEEENQAIYRKAMAAALKQFGL